jgi:hypothetical protein
MPSKRGALAHFADRLDPVALDADLANDVPPSDKVTDHRIKNPYRLDLRAGGPHAASGYLSDLVVRDAVRYRVVAMAISA